MNNLSLDLPVKLEELCKFTFNFNNLIKVINYLHQHNLNLQTELKDINQRVYSLESLKSDIEDMKIKSLNIQKSNDNLNQKLVHIQNEISKFKTNFEEINKKHEIFKEKITDLEKEKNAHEKNLNHLNEVVEENIKKTNYLEDISSSDRKKIGIIDGKVNENTKKNDELKNNINEINKNFEENKKNLEEIDTNVKNIIDTTEKKNVDLDNRILNIVNDVANISNQINNIPTRGKSQIITRISSDINKNNSPEDIISTKVAEPSFNVDLNLETNDLVKAIMDEVDEQKIKFNKLKEDIKLNRENQTKQNDNFKSNISKIIEDINNLKNEFEENFEKMENNINVLSLQKNDLLESKPEIKKSDSSTSTENKNINLFLNKYVPMETYKKLNDKVSILTSTINTKVNADDNETRFKKYNVRLEKLEMAVEGQTHGPRPRINLELVNKVIEKENLTEIPSEYRSQLEEIDAWAKIVEKKMGKNIKELISKQIDRLDKELNEKTEEIINNSLKNNKDIEKNNKSIIDIRNILVNLPTKADLNKLKNEQDKTSKDCKLNRIKIEEIIKNIEGEPDNEDENNQDDFPGTIYEKLKYLNHNNLTLSNKVISLDNKHKLITKEVKDDIKQNLKIETAKIMQQFKTRLESFTNRFEYELKNKIDQIGLTDFENKINNKFYIDLRDKLDKNDLKKNNNLLNRKIDNLESKISKTLVDTIIDIQMDDQPLIIKKNGNGNDVCASCNQPVTKINTCGGGKDFFNGNMNNSTKAKGLNRSLNFTQPINIKSNTINDKNTKSNLGQNKLPDIAPNIYQK